MKLPPFQFEGDFIVVTREPHGATVVVTLPNQDSYELFPEEFEMWLRKIDVPSEVGFLDYIWNFYSAKLLLKEDFHIESLTMEQAEAFSRRPEAVKF